MAQFDADIALRVQVLDSEIKELESRINKINNTKITVNPYLPSGARRADAITRSEADRLKIQQAGLQIDKNRLQLEQSIRTEQLKSLNTRSSWVRFLEKGAQLQRDIAQNSAREATNAAKAASARRGQRLESLALGAGFPLLFGGGPGAVVGGVAGSFLGKGFGGQIILSAIGQQFDKLFEEVGKTGVALTSTAGAFDLMNEKSLFSSDAARELATQLEEQGRAQELAALLSEELAAQLGAKGVEALQSAGDETKEFTRLVNLLFTQLSAFVSGPLASFLALINQGLGALTTNITYGSIKDQLEGEARKRLDQLERQERGVTTGNVRGRGRTQEVLGSLTTTGQKNILETLRKEGLLPTAKIPVTEDDKRSIKAPKTPKGPRDTSVRDLAQSESLLRQLQQQLAVAQAKEGLDSKVLRISQTYENSLQRISQLKDQSLAKEQAQAALQIRNAQINKAVQDFEEKRAESIDRVFKTLQNERAELLATTDLQKDNLRVQQIVDQLERAKIVLNDKQLQQLRDLIAGNRQLAQEKQTQLFLDQQLEAAINGIGRQAAGLMETLITGTDDWAASLNNALKSLASLLFNVGLSALGGGDNRGLFSILSGDFKVGARAKGGPVTSGSPYVVGEKGPELFVPGRSGTIVPNDAMGGGVNSVVNVNISDSGVSTDASQGAALGREINSAVTAILIRERRPGGLLSR